MRIDARHLGLAQARIEEGAGQVGGQVGQPVVEERVCGGGAVGGRGGQAQGRQACGAGDLNLFGGGLEAGPGQLHVRAPGQHIGRQAYRRGRGGERRQGDGVGEGVGRWRAPEQHGQGMRKRALGGGGRGEGGFDGGDRLALAVEIDRAGHGAAEAHVDQFQDLAVGLELLDQQRAGHACGDQVDPGLAHRSHE